MQSEYLNRLTLMIDKLSKKGKLKQVPVIEIRKMQKNWLAYSEKTPIKETKIVLSNGVYSLWTDNRVEDWDIEGIIAHEIGHSMNYGKIFSLVCHLIQGTLIVIPLILGYESINMMNLNIGLLSLLSVIPCLFVARQFNMWPEFNADKNAKMLVDDPKQVLLPVFKIARIQGLVNRKKKRFLLQKINPFARPSLKERVKRMGLDPKDYGY